MKPLQDKELRGFFLCFCNHFDPLIDPLQHFLSHYRASRKPCIRFALSCCICSLT